MNNQMVKKAPFLLFLLVFPALGKIYELLNNRPHQAVDISTTLDHYIPFMPIFIIPYIFWYGYIFIYLVYFCFKDTNIYLKTILLIVAAECICFLVYYFFQTTVPRPEVVGNEFLDSLVKWIYAKDQPYNCFPSIHVLTTFAIILASLHIKNKNLLNTLCIHVIGSLIIISTLFIKQHVIFDMIGSLFLVTFLYGISFDQLWIHQKTETAYAKDK